MHFRLLTSRTLYHDEDRRPLERLGFRFRPSHSSEEWWVLCEDPPPLIELADLPALLQFAQQVQAPLILTVYPGSDGACLEIYNDYRE